MENVVDKETNEKGFSSTHPPTLTCYSQSMKSRHCVRVSVTFTLLFTTRLVEGSCHRLCSKCKHAFSSLAFLQVGLRNYSQIFGRRLYWDDGSYREWMAHSAVSAFFLLAIVILCVFATNTSQLFTK